jgi:hypothetical protein
MGLLLAVVLPLEEEEEEEVVAKTSLGTMFCHPIGALGELPATSFPGPVVVEVGLGDMRRAGEASEEAEEEVLDAKATAVKTTATKAAITTPTFPRLPRPPSCCCWRRKTLMVAPSSPWPSSTAPYCPWLRVLPSSTMSVCGIFYWLAVFCVKRGMQWLVGGWVGYGVVVCCGAWG